MTHELAERFSRAATEAGARHRTDIAGVFEQLSTAYAEPKRHYHGIDHVRQCLVSLDELHGSLRSPAELELAIWFHDAVHSMTPLAQNEERSAELAYASCLRMGIDGGTSHRIATMVRATRNHTLPSTVESGDSDFGIFLDIDLAILGADEVAYARYEKAIREEFAWMVFEGLYRRGRAKVLSRFLARPSVFQHPRMQATYERRARRNIEGAIQEQLATHDFPYLHATDEHIFLTRAARLEELHAWSALYYVTYLPEQLSGGNPRLLVNFGPLDDRPIDVEVGSPRTEAVVARLRALPGYRHEQEERSNRTGDLGLVYSQARCGVVSGPVRLPPPTLATQPYRS
ncbi:hypothetical protein AKJ09_07886 [Labilithrix luteola]|uniref:Uncharacterized protein n=1 Tax=Labilithrix luteola TaxID=1391654 RepID=A0A0K1Q673_9BACT|nr:hypothetical protein [Labilithrix luteola]AKV01223.1 hypothetical protein AKJ09_07886 [Labilithrix luteola]